MAKKPPKDKTRYVERCIFCPSADLSETHIFPQWLDTIIRDPGPRISEFYQSQYPSPNQRVTEATRTIKSGRLFSMRPHLCCRKCNSEWLSRIETEMVKFANPLFTSTATVSLNNRQLRIMSIWIGVITILSQYLSRRKSAIIIPDEERNFIRTRLALPPTWSVVGCSMNADAWRARYRRLAIYVGRFDGHNHSNVLPETKSNSQIASFGMGDLFVQTFRCPDPVHLQTFEISAKATGLAQLWPPPAARFWPFKQRTTKFPTKLIIDDAQADDLANAFYKRLEALAAPPHFGMPPELR